MSVLIQNGTVVTASHSEKADLRLEHGVIAERGAALPPNGSTCFDASGCLIFPGFIDAHTHLDMDNGMTVTADNFSSGTKAALFGGTTTIIDFATQDKGRSLADALAIWHKKADNNCACDYSFHMAITDWNASVSEEIGDMASKGVTSFKLYMAYDALRVNDGEIYEILKRVGKAGGIVGVHCENGDLVNSFISAHLSAGNVSPSCHPASRPDFVEAEAISRYCWIGYAAGAPIHIVHLSTALGLEEVRRARARGQAVYVETCPQYLVLEDSRYLLPGFEGAKYVCSPPLRKKTDQDALWHALQNREIDTISTDHCSYSFKGQKDLGLEDFSKIPNGLPGLEHRPALVYTYGVVPGHITANDMARLLSEAPARLFGLYPRKGTLSIGSDADLVIWDPSCKGHISAAAQHHNCDYTPYEGMDPVGGVKAVFLRGQPAILNGRFTEGITGIYLPRASCANF